MSNIWRPRITVDISSDLYERLTKALPHGTRNQIFTVIMEHLCKAIEEQGQVIAYLILNDKIHLFGGRSDDVRSV